jgi:hypothetical protein
MRPNNDFVKALDSAVPLDPHIHAATDKQCFCYRGAMGELIWPMITTCPELVFPVMKLSQFSVAPVMIHYDAILAIFRYLSVTKHHGISYTQIIPVKLLPDIMPPNQSAFPSDAPNDHHLMDLYDLLYGYADYDWAMDIGYHHSISGIMMMLAGSAIAWKCCVVQITISLSLTESEILSSPSILAELSHTQHHPTVIFQDNRAAVLISQVSHPTRQTCHIDIHEFALLDWNDCGRSH